MKYHYTTHGWTLVSAVVEKVVKISFPVYMKTFFHEMGLKNTYLDENKPIIYNRAKLYRFCFRDLFYVNGVIIL